MSQRDDYYPGEDYYGKLSWRKALDKLLTAFGLAVLLAVGCLGAVLMCAALQSAQQ